MFDKRNKKISNLFILYKLIIYGCIIKDIIFIYLILNICPFWTMYRSLASSTTHVFFVQTKY